MIPKKCYEIWNLQSPMEGQIFCSLLLLGIHEQNFAFGTHKLSRPSDTNVLVASKCLDLIYFTRKKPRKFAFVYFVSALTAVVKLLDKKIKLHAAETHNTYKAGIIILRKFHITTVM